MLERQVGKLTTTCNGLERDVTALQLDIKELEGKKKTIQDQFDILLQLEDKGFDTEVLNKIAEIGKKYGSPGQVIQAISAYDSLHAINKEIDNAKIKTDSEKATLAKLEAEHIHLKALIDMSKELLKRQFTVEAVQQVYDIAKQYGDSIEVLKALGEHRKLANLQQEVSKMSDSKVALEAEINLLSVALTTLKAHMTAIDGQIKQTINSMNLELSNAVKTGAANISSTFAGEAQRLRKAVDEYAKQAKEAGILEDDMELLKVIHAVTKFPDAMGPVSIKYAGLFLDMATRIIEAVGVNRKMDGANISALDAILIARRQLNPPS